MSLWELYGEASKTAVGFFWKAGWAFVLGYWVSAMIQAFVPKGRLTPYMGKADFKSVSLATVFGAASSSCSFAALAAARALVLKGAHFVAAVAFMFASTNLVVELGILILIFLGWQFLAAEIVGGLFLIGISSVLIKLTYPKRWIEDAREALEKRAGNEDEDFNWKQRVLSREGWELVGHHFVSDWKMVWEEIVIGFTIAGFMAVVVPPSLWEKIFLMGEEGNLPEWLIVLENTVVAPFVAAATFIGSMGNIPLATVLNTNGVMFAGIMGFIYSDLMVPPLVMINAKYYGWRVALYIAAVMFCSIVLTAITMHYVFSTLNIMPKSSRRVEDIAQFALDYTFYLNVIFVFVAAWLVWLHKRYSRKAEDRMQHGASERIGLEKIIALLCLVILMVGLLAFLLRNL
ncbi:MAG: permease [Deltaproteobacteria bacterium]|nr:MAG: permease [Deltaproteobacteria bacterium]